MDNWKFYNLVDEYVLNYDDMFYVYGEPEYGYDGVTSVEEWDKFILEKAFQKLSSKARASAAEAFYAQNKIHEFFWVGKDAFVSCGKYYEISMWGCIHTYEGKTVDIDDISFGHDLKAQESVKARLMSERDEERMAKAYAAWEETWIHGY